MPHATFLIKKRSPAAAPDAKCAQLCSKTGCFPCDFLGLGIIFGHMCPGECALKVAVIDIGKTNAKLLLIDLATGAEMAVYKTPNRVLPGPPYPHFDTEALWSFLLDSFTDMAKQHRPAAISITTHGAAAALMTAQGGLALPILDYEHDGPQQFQADYTALRPDFAETGSAQLPGGLNLGAQLYWQARRFPAEFAETAHILTYPQYWAFRLTGVSASEVTSLGCHTDLWDPWRGQFSTLLARASRDLGGPNWHDLFPGLRPAAARLGGLLPDLAALTGLPADLPVYSGIHDSNASLLPYLGGKESAFSVVSSGTWMICLAIGGDRVALDARRDTLVNVNANGGPTPTARYMGGREFDEITAGAIVEPARADTDQVIAAGIMALPSLHPETGPFPGLQFGWTIPPANAAERSAAAAYYVALVVAECLALIGAKGPIHVEGPFGGNRCFAEMLATATGRNVIGRGQSAGTGLGAALLVAPLAGTKTTVDPVQPQPRMQAYADAWRAKVATAWAAQAR